jgi:DNA (cytosine-5)-methyltransferase 1
MYNYKWKLKDTVFTKDKGKVFSCFACGGGSSMGYKLAGFDVIGVNEIDPRMMEVYKVNHNPKYSYLEGIQTFKDRNNLPDELFDLDILDGSPPCSSFSMAGNREKDWGKEKKFREGQSEQVLDTLFFDFIELAAKLKPKIIIAENVKGLLMGDAKKYLHKIYHEFEKAGYYTQYWLLDSSKMGVPQKRERVFFICLRKDLAAPFLYQQTFFDQKPYLDLFFNERKIYFNEIDFGYGKKLSKVYEQWWKLTKPGYSFSTAHPKGSFFNTNKIHKNKILPTITATSGAVLSHYKYPNQISDKSLQLAGSFPLDYNFIDNKPKYLIGMSVPPVMIAQIANQVYKQWLSKINPPGGSNTIC